MGRVRSSVGYLGNVSRLLLGELVVRTMKNLLRARFRRIMKEGGEKSESLFVAATVDFLTQTTGATEEGRAFLVGVAQGMRDRFGQEALTDGEAADLLSAVGPPYGYPLIIEHLLDRVGVTLTDTSRCRAGGWEGRGRPRRHFLHSCNICFREASLMGCSLLLWWPFSLCRRQLLAVEDLKFFQFTRADIFDMRPRFVLLFLFFP
jgi:hypothetical protein